ncbi:hydroxyacid dehydrogenase [Fictibacillus phosphorivorans]|uniref:Hydroxyacid dehydrogenase n=1 Tax=Fictibacillus phosphorivorans TaxID=1221500 RepID=A0A165P5A7_9BACL|nr:D-2-hydroxyacid dehydrogenase family protein [Fictibacillus phosphorivorans]KZE69015.1 hydroxyacid dehydrogenase [Fictibacillus phosphorivorans]
MNVVILDDWEQCFAANPEIERLKQHFSVEVYHDKPTQDELLNRIEYAYIIIPIRERTLFSKEVLMHLKNIKLIAQTGAGLAHIDMDTANQLNIPVATTPGGSAAVVELIFGMMLAHARNLLLLDQEMKQGKWMESVGSGLENKTVGIIGLGKIGSGVAKIAKAFNMNVVAWGPRLTKERAHAQEVEYLELNQLLQISHFVILAVRLVPATKHLLKEEHFKEMRNDAFLINTSRGEVVDEEALVKALSEKWIGGAGLDVFSVEPLGPNHPLLQLQNVVLTPHIGWKTDNMFHKFLSTSVENILSFMIVGNPQRIVNIEVLKSKKPTV